MPAVTVENTLLRPRVAEPDPATAQQRPVRRLTSAPRRPHRLADPPRR